MKKIVLPLAALVVSLAAFTAQAATVHFDSGSAEVNSGQAARHKQKVWVPAHRSGHRRVKGHYVWR